MTISDRLFSIADQCRRENGDGFLRQPDQFVPRITGQAPDLFSEIKALGRAFEIGAAERIQGAGNAEAEAETVAREIAESENVSFNSAQSAVAVARRIGALGSSPAGVGDWAGDSMVVGAAGATAQQPPPVIAQDAEFDEDDEDDEDETESEPFWKNKWALGGGAAVIAFFFYTSQQAPQQIAQGPGPDQQVGAGGGPAQGPGGGGQGPRGGQGPGGMNPGGGGQGPAGGNPGATTGQGGPPLLNNDANNMPRVRAETAQGGQMGVMFSIMTQNGPVPGMVMTPRNWTGGPGYVGFWPAGTTDFNTPMASMGSGQFQFFNNQGRPVRYIIPQWTNDNIGLGNICVSFEAPQAMQETPLSGAQICVRGGDCGEAAGCGIVQ